MNMENFGFTLFAKVDQDLVLEKKIEKFIEKKRKILKDSATKKKEKKIKRITEDAEKEIKRLEEDLKEEQDEKIRYLNLKLEEENLLKDIKI